MKHDEHKLVDLITKERDRDTNAKLAFYEQDLKLQSTRIKELENLMQSLYEDKVNKVIPENIFTTLMQKYDKERVEKNNNIPVLQEKIANGKKHTADIGAWVKMIRNYTNLEVLDRAILLELVDKIEIYKPEKVDGKRICDIKIYYRYVGSFDSTDAGAVEVDYEQAI